MVSNRAGHSPPAIAAQPREPQSRWDKKHLPACFLLPVLACCLAGCGDVSAAQPLAEWTLRVGGDPQGEWTLPAHLPKSLVADAPSFSLTADVQVDAALLDRHLWFLVPTYEGSARLYVDGQEQVPRQDPGDRRHHGTYRWHVGQRSDATKSMHLELVCSGKFVQAHWLDTVPLLSATPDTTLTKAIYVVNDRLALVAIGLMAQVSLVCFVLYYLRRKKQYLWFALEAMGASSYDFDILGISGTFIGAYDMAAMGASLCVASLLSVYFLHAHFDLSRPGRAWNFILVLAGLCVPFGLQGSTALPLLVIICLVPAIVENFRVCLKLVLQNKHRTDASILLTAWLLLAVVASGEACPWLGFGEVFLGLRPGGAGLGLFALVLCLLLTSGYGQAMQSTDALNLELLRQIKDRSRQMYNALAIAGGEVRELVTLGAGQIIQNRYRVVAPLGKGGMGAVYEVVRIADKESMALKVTRNVDGKALARLAKEAELGVQIQNKYVVTLSDVDVSDAGFIYIVMELVRGPPLEACRAALLHDMPSVLLILKRISLGLCALHERGIIHRDLKPANVLTNYPWTKKSEAVIKIADFGISRLEGPRAEIYEPPVLGPAQALDEHSTILLANRLGTAGSSSNDRSPYETHAGMMGTPRYMAPELALGGPFLTPATDIFSFGIIAYELLTGGYPFDSPPVMRVADNKPFRLAAPLPNERAQQIPGRLVQVLQRTLSGGVHHRPTAEELAATFEA